jgi:ligand-binding sensor domain-containing protein
MHGLFGYSASKTTHYTVDEGLADHRVYAITETHDGDLWVGTFSGLSHLRRGGITNCKTADGFPYNLVQSLYADRAGRLWIGTRDGLLYFQNEQFVLQKSIAGGKPVTGIISIAEDAAGTLWVGAHEGLFRRTPQGLLRHNTARALPSRLIAALHTDRGGNVWLGMGNNGGIAHSTTSHAG